MLTRCTHCQTYFSVTAAQLKIRRGQVRCGVCQKVFDALDGLSDEVPVLQAIHAAPPVAEDESWPSPDDMSKAPAATITIEPIQATTHGPPEIPVAPAPVRRWLWVIGSLILLFVAVAQLVYVFRTEPTVPAPWLQPTLLAGCELLGRTLSRPATPELLDIETSDLALTDNGLLLTATLTNRAPFEQDFPHLELTLTDTQDIVLVRKVLPPTDYLPIGRDAAQGFAARSEVAIRLALTTDNVPAVGYRLYLFYP